MASSSIPREGKPLPAAPICSSHRGGRLPWQLEVPIHTSHSPLRKNKSPNTGLCSQLVGMQHPELSSLQGLTRGHSSEQEASLSGPTSQHCPGSRITVSRQHFTNDNWHARQNLTLSRNGLGWWAGLPLTPPSVFGGSVSTPGISFNAGKKGGASSWGTHPPQLHPLWGSPASSSAATFSGSTMSFLKWSHWAAESGTLCHKIERCCCLYSS